MGIIKLDQMEFFAHNGYYEEERNTGNRYSVSIEIDTNFDLAGQSDDLNETINYEVLYTIAKTEIHKRSKLLEHIVFNINHAVLTTFPGANWVKTSVCKQNPPFGGLCKQVCVSDLLEQK